MVELERTFLLKNIPKGMESCRWIEIFDIYVPTNADHPFLRIRKCGDKFEITKKFPLQGKDSSEQKEITILLLKEEFEELSQISGKRLHKRRYFYHFGNKIAQIDIFLDNLEGLALVDFEFKTKDERDNFKMPDFCLADVTQEEFIAGGMLAGKKYSDIQKFLEKYNYQKINF